MWILSAVEFLTAAGETGLVSFVFYVFFSFVSGAPRVTQTNFLVPLQLVLKPAMPVKSAMYKVTIETNKPPVNLNDIFTGRLCYLLISGKVSMCEAQTLQTLEQNTCIKRLCCRHFLKTSKRC